MLQVVLQALFFCVKAEGIRPNHGLFRRPSPCFQLDKVPFFTPAFCAAARRSFHPFYCLSSRVLPIACPLHRLAHRQRKGNLLEGMQAVRPPCEIAPLNVRVRQVFIQKEAVRLQQGRPFRLAPTGAHGLAPGLRHHPHSPDPKRIAFQKSRGGIIKRHGAPFSSKPVKGRQGAADFFSGQLIRNPEPCEKRPGMGIKPRRQQPFSQVVPGKIHRNKVYALGHRPPCPPDAPQLFRLRSRVIHLKHLHTVRAGAKGGGIHARPQHHVLRCAEAAFVRQRIRAEAGAPAV